MVVTLIVFLLILSLLVFVHELGHFLVAKKAGIGVEEFGFGLPPRILGVNYKGTVYSINLLPIGGFVKLLGEEETAREKERGKAKQFWAKSKKVRIAVVVAGVLMNFLLAIVVFSLVYTKMGIPTKTSQVKIVGLVPSSPAEMAGLKLGDLVVLAGGEKISDSQVFIALTKRLAGREMELEVVREKDNPCPEVSGISPGIKIACRGQNMVFTLVPRVSPPPGEGPLGVAISDLEMKFYPLWQMPARGAVEGVKEAFAWTVLIVGALASMLWQLVSLGVVPKDVAGPVGIFQITSHVAQGGVLAIFQFLGILSVNLAVINILPIPALDGGRLLFIGIEAVTGKRLRVRVEQIANQIGMMVLFILIILITYNDILRILKTTALGTRLGEFLP